jgi:dTDP-4-dehydrorhamnose reductase|tara:strand:- start:482 stop:1348 length:867 start_codon:yes stop_codon:yes gene_type:complete
MSVLVFGANGQLGQALRSVEPACLDVTYTNRKECDVADPEAVRQLINQIDPDYIVNCAAYTAVDKAEEDIEACYLINRDGVQNIADCCFDRHLIHISTDFVFDGTKTTPYKPSTPPNPVSVYGVSKLAGEKSALTTIPKQVMIIRTAWLYYTLGANFVNTMLHLMSERDELNVVNDQRGTPTFARSLAQAIWDVITRSLFAPGIYHWTDAGEITWYDFAVAIQEEGREKGQLTKTIPIEPIPSEKYPTAATRPAYSVLDCTSMEILINQKRTPWRDNLGVMLKELSIQ